MALIDGAVPTTNACHRCGGILWYFPRRVGGSTRLFCYRELLLAVGSTLLACFERDRKTPDGRAYWPRADVGSPPLDTRED